MIPCVFFLLIFLSLNTSSVAQDTIFFFKSPPIVVKISSIENRVVKYKKTTLPDGPDYVISKRSVKKIVYGDGKEANLKIQKTPIEPAPLSWDFLKGKTHVNIIVSDLFWQFGSIEIEHNFFKAIVRYIFKLPYGRS